MTHTCFARLRDDRGAVLVHVTVAVIGLIAFSAVVIDYGVMWSSRRQAQNAADAAAMAGAISLAYDDPDDFQRARDSAVQTGVKNVVFGIAPNIDRSADISFPTCPPGAPGLPDTCVRANVYRNESKNPLPTFFARLFGRSIQGVKATATAQVLTGNATDCLKPWAVADKWEEHVECTNYQNNGSCNGTYEPNSTWTTDSTFDKYKDGGLNPDIPYPTPGYDVYRAPGTNGDDDPGTGYQAFNPDGTPGPDYGRVLQLKLGSGQPDERYSSGWYKRLDLPCGGAEGCPESSGSNKYKWQIKNCIGVTEGIGDTLTIDNQTGNATGPTSQAVYESHGQDTPALVERDPGARWNPTTKTIENSCAPGVCADGAYYTESPRIVHVPVFSLDAYLAANPNGSGETITVSNVFGFFILTPEQAEDLGEDLGNGNIGDNVFGVLVAIPGKTKGSSVIPLESAFMREVILVR